MELKKKRNGIHRNDKCNLLDNRGDPLNDWGGTFSFFIYKLIESKYVSLNYCLWHLIEDTFFRNLQKSGLYIIIKAIYNPAKMVTRDDT